MENYSVKSDNINTLWLGNIYENIKRLEEYERIAREGCANLFEYLQIPERNRELILGDTQFKNIRFMITEIHLLLADLTPILEEDKITCYKDNLEKIEEVLKNKKLFIKEPYSTTKQMILSSKPTELFHQTLKFLSEMKIDIIRDIKGILFIKDSGIPGY